MVYKIVHDEVVCCTVITSPDDSAFRTTSATSWKSGKAPRSNFEKATVSLTVTSKEPEKYKQFLNNLWTSALII